MGVGAGMRVKARHYLVSPSAQKPFAVRPREEGLVLTP